VGRLLLAVIVVLALPALPLGTYLMYPFVILTTWFHEMGHGLTAALLGQHFEQLRIYANGSGVAESFVEADASPLTLAAIAAGGPLAPTIVGAGLIIASAHARLWRPVLWLVAAAIFASVIVYVRSPVGFAVLPLVAALLALIAWRAQGPFTRFTLQFLGVLAAMSMLQDFNYLFTEEAVIAGQRIVSDTGQIEDALFLPHWFWAAAILAISAVTIGASLRYALSDKRRLPPARALPKNVVRFRRPKR
jgi:hypothetical protein